MNVTSHPVSPIQAIGSNVTLTCIVELSPAVDVPVTVNTVWSGPPGFGTTNTAQTVMGSNATYISTAMVSSFNRKKSGDYTCTATVISESPYITNSSSFCVARITAGKSTNVTQPCV